MRDGLCDTNGTQVLCQHRSNNLHLKWVSTGSARLPLKDNDCTQVHSLICHTCSGVAETHVMSTQSFYCSRASTTRRLGSDQKPWSSKTKHREVPTMARKRNQNWADEVKAWAGTGLVFIWDVNQPRSSGLSLSVECVGGTTHRVQSSWNSLQVGCSWRDVCHRPKALIRGMHTVTPRRPGGEEERKQRSIITLAHIWQMHKWILKTWMILLGDQCWTDCFQHSWLSCLSSCVHTSGKPNKNASSFFCCRGSNQLDSGIEGLTELPVPFRAARGEIIPKRGQQI